MAKRVYISADYDEDSGDRNVVSMLNKWNANQWYIVDFVDMAQVKSGSVSLCSDCRPCDLKAEFNRQIAASSTVIFIVGDKTANRTAGSSCLRGSKSQYECFCTPYKQNAGGTKFCKVPQLCSTVGSDDVSNVNSYSYLRHEFEEAVRRKKDIIILYNSLQKMESWLPFYMKDHASIAQPFWTYDAHWNKVGNYQLIKKALGYG